MTTTAFIRKHINRYSDGKIFMTSELLDYGSRSAVDFALQKLAANRRIIRLSRGMFMRGDETTPLPSTLEVACAKANACGMRIIFCGDENLTDATSGSSKGQANTQSFWVDGAPRSFQYGAIRIVLKPIRARKRL